PSVPTRIFARVVPGPAGSSVTSMGVPSGFLPRIVIGPPAGAVVWTPGPGWTVVPGAWVPAGGEVPGCGAGVVVAAVPAGPAWGESRISSRAATVARAVRSVG